MCSIDAARGLRLAWRFSASQSYRARVGRLYALRRVRYWQRRGQLGSRETAFLRQDEIPLALLFFNVGVELGQVAFVFVVLGLVRSFRTLEIVWPRWVELVPGYAVGTLGALWFIQRTAILLGLL